MQNHNSEMQHVKHDIQTRHETCIISYMSTECQSLMEHIVVTSPHKILPNSYVIVQHVKHFTLCTDYRDKNLPIIHLERAYCAL